MNQPIKENSLKKASKLLSFVLRHKPESIGITLDEHGWAKVNDVVFGISKVFPFSLELLETIVSTDEKGRYAFSEDKTLIRANYGHSVNVDLEYAEGTPPDILYHGTSEKYVSSILEQGLTAKSRLYVHLSENVDTAKQVGARHGIPVVFAVDCKQMAEDGHRFFRSQNGIWLVRNVPHKYLKSKQ